MSRIRDPALLVIQPQRIDGRVYEFRERQLPLSVTLIRLRSTSEALSASQCASRIQIQARPQWASSQNYDIAPAVLPAPAAPGGASYGRNHLGAFVPAAQHDFGMGDPVIGGGPALKKSGSAPLESLCSDRLPSLE
jgi:hypothetical protein